MTSAAPMTVKESVLQWLRNSPHGFTARASVIETSYDAIGDILRIVDEQMARAEAAEAESAARLEVLAKEITALRDEAEKAEAESARLREALEDMYANGGGPDDTGDRHLCRGCGVDLSMRGHTKEITEHSDDCVYRAIAVALNP